MRPSRLRRWLGATLLLLCGALPSRAAAQETYSIRGTVISAADQAPLAAVRVAIRGTTISTVTDANGVYTLQARVSPGSYTLVATLLGRQSGSVQVALAGNASVQVPAIRLAEGAVLLDEMIVTGTAAPTSRRALGNSVATVDATDISQSQALTIDQALQGKVAGAVITSNTGTPGGGVSIRLRGTSSITGGAEPLYIVDGVIIDNNADEQINVGYRSNPVNRLADLDPADIERIEILKGAAAAALYGSRANNGVVQIFTRRGQAGRPVFNVSSRVGRSDLENRIDFALTPVNPDGTAAVRYDHQDLLFREGTSRDLHLNVSGGVQATRYFLSANYVEQEGIMLGSAHDKVNLRLNLDQEFGDRFSVGAGVNFVRSNTDLIISGEQGEGGLLTAIVFTPTTVDLTAINPETGAYRNNAGPFVNPLTVVENWDLEQIVDRFVGSFQARANPITDLTLEYRLGYDSYRMETQQFIPPTPSVAAQGRAVSANRGNRLINNDLVGNFLWRPVSDLQMTSSLGMNHTYQRVDQLNASAQDIIPGSRLVRGAVQFATESKTELATLGFFGQQQAAWRERLFLTGAMRWDASSTFGDDERWQFYPKASVSYVLSEEPFFRNSGVGGTVNELRLRAALGYAGNQPPLNAAYARASRFGSSVNIDRLGLIPLSQAGNADLAPERQREVELGADLSLWDDRIGLSATWYEKYTRDLLLPRPFAPSAGVATVLENVGELSNRGVELQLETVNLQGERFGWSSTIIYSRNRNKVEKLEIPAYFVGYGNRVEEGQPLGVLYLPAYMRDEQGNIVSDSVGPRLAAARDIVGNPWPDYAASLRNEFRLGRAVTVSFLLDGQFGHELWNQTRRIMDVSSAGPLYDALLRGEITQAQRARLQSIWEYYVEDASFIKLRDLTLRWSVPSRLTGRFNAQSVQLELQGRNLHTWTDYSGYDPEINMFGLNTVERGVDFAVYPNAREVSLGVRLNF
ncbi:TonB-dependent receptor domain-containing protein [Longimicrobium sp.]|uniref:TonB-dependent receptor domain-containing protein n=1 Tax=Longimicrobium sp. TaxID=2029185 RepID=UPI003B3ABB21